MRRKTSLASCEDSGRNEPHNFHTFHGEPLVNVLVAKMS